MKLSVIYYLHYSSDDDSGGDEAATVDLGGLQWRVLTEHAAATGEHGRVSTGELATLTASLEMSAIRYMSTQCPEVCDEMAVRVHEAVAEVEHGADLATGMGRAESAEVGSSVNDVELRVAAKVAFLPPASVGGAKQGENWETDSTNHYNGQSRWSTTSSIEQHSRTLERMLRQQNARWSQTKSWPSLHLPTTHPKKTYGTQQNALPNSTRPSRPKNQSSRHGGQTVRRPTLYPYKDGVHVYAFEDKYKRDTAAALQAALGTPYNRDGVVNDVSVCTQLLSSRRSQETEPGMSRTIASKGYSSLTADTLCGVAHREGNTSP
ncbi:hypothetical protein O1611_g8469 [Lasiodiplodia mahajangana]|uniref:Uncharacterized protein n=1 Tax=Lasiodiplodia mahajangana TaxID=1108764 RepID=A0ACC2JD08_9PEZI|nr:hypothetical protein O1611_g8469 [Lasiodiplodia mahajangana]